MSKIVDHNGFVDYPNTLLTKEGVFDYLGKQIDQDGRYGLKPNAIYKVYRPKDEVCSKEFIESMEKKPLIDNHTMIGEGFTPAERKGVHGVMTSIHVDEQQKNVVKGTITVYSSKMLDEIRNGKRELSLGYTCKYRKESGQFDGQPYDFVQFGLMCNHIALVDKARMGSDCRVMDCMAMDSVELNQMTVDEIMTALKGCSDEDIAKIKDSLGCVKAEEGKTEDEEKAKEEAEAKAKAEQEAKDKAEEEAKAKAEQEAKDKAEQEAKAKEEQEAKDKAEEEAKQKEAMDSAVSNARKELAEAYVFAEKCKPLVGAIAMDGLFTAEDVALKVCGMKNINIEKGFAKARVEGMLDVLGAGNKIVTGDSAVKPNAKSLTSWFKGK